ncbi:MAG TPA: tyrosine-type recombinase/integrase [Terriglobales bacterium]|nr:tyrosine-type recombinase/integrase [Terriglobales bacterium]
MKLNELIARYVAFRKSMGTDFASAESLLNTFCRRMGMEIDVAEIQAEQVELFLTGTGPVNRYWRRKYDTLRGLYRYATSRGFVDYVPLPATVPKMPERLVPYIYSADELQRLINPTAPQQIGFRKLQPHTLRAILLLLYGAGLRIGEAVALTLGDVDLSAAVITIRNTKFHKTRLVPIGARLNLAIVQYAAQRKEAGHSQSTDAPFFVLRRGGPVSIQIVRQVFIRLRTHAGVGRADGARYQPRLHDMRHSFAVRRLTSWYEQGADVQRLLPHLATYLGHVSIAATQVYLTMTPELLHAASRRFERYALPEAHHD